MSELHTAPSAPPAPSRSDNPFTQQELKSFTTDDQQAGRAICKMLSLFFFYTVIVMGLSAYVTYVWVVNE